VATISACVRNLPLLISFRVGSVTLCTRASPRAKIVRSVVFWIDRMQLQPLPLMADDGHERISAPRHPQIHARPAPSVAAATENEIPRPTVLHWGSPARTTCTGAGRRIPSGSGSTIQRAGSELFGTSMRSIAYVRLWAPSFCSLPELPFFFFAPYYSYLESVVHRAQL
jgi:hypothetical protein